MFSSRQAAIILLKLCTFERRNGPERALFTGQKQHLIFFGILGLSADMITTISTLADMIWGVTAGLGTMPTTVLENFKSTHGLSGP